MDGHNKQPQPHRNNKEARRPWAKKTINKQHNISKLFKKMQEKHNKTKGEDSTTTKQQEKTQQQTTKSQTNR